MMTGQWTARKPLAVPAHDRLEAGGERSHGSGALREIIGRPAVYHRRNHCPHADIAGCACRDGVVAATLAIDTHRASSDTRR